MLYMKVEKGINPKQCKTYAAVTLLSRIKIRKVRINFKSNLEELKAKFFIIFNDMNHKLL